MYINKVTKAHKDNIFCQLVNYTAVNRDYILWVPLCCCWYCVCGVNIAKSCSQFWKIEIVAWMSKIIDKTNNNWKYDNDKLWIRRAKLLLKELFSFVVVFSQAFKCQSCIMPLLVHLASLVTSCRKWIYLHSEVG